ncbi:MAG: hypothetical protein EOQ28_03010 [Mesorhizobium sp.]|uniref:hypothetical protein n=1 Tax=Mesorhizobium sp. TaxID=1871066 RepID=UPI000FE82E7B|nr:hypothetical protein [Mesorhizobium sp.]RWA76670.1 MAG: hypothetical protein EOQ28_03010 [Mesorhizobium sp.]RWC05070.1 MAG: hypothetical protein EOQ57_05660 [Mesorhizobium sp.]
MTATTIKQTESRPASYPLGPVGLTPAAEALDEEMIWQRIEAYVAYRWTERAVTWIVEGCGEWHPPLTPATIDTVELWQADAWQAVTLSPSPLGGYCLPGGTYRFTGSVGSTDSPPIAPEIVDEAFRRLAEFMAATLKGTPGLTAERVTAGSVTVEKTRSASWASEAMSNSGAGDLLRSYRRA